MLLTSYEQIRKLARGSRRRTLAVVEAADQEVLKACREARDSDIADSILIGRTADITRTAKEHGIDISDFKMIESPVERSVAAAAKLCTDGEAEMLMKGHIPTGTLMKGVLDKENGLRVGAILSHTMVGEAKNFGRFLLLSDAGLNIAPDADTLAAIVANAVTVAHALGIEKPKVACLSAIEVINPKIPSTVLCTEMKKRGAEGAFGECVVDGPIALDLALSPHAVEAKDYPDTSVAGGADILIVPELVSGNVLGKSMIYLAQYRCGGIIIGAKVPIVLLSRSDTSETKLDSIALASVFAKFHSEKR